MSAIYERWEDGKLVEVKHSFDWEAGWQACEDFLDHVMKNVTRVEVIDSRGRSYTNWNVTSIEQQFQDEGRTLKLILTDTKDEN